MSDDQTPTAEEAAKAKQAIVAKLVEVAKQPKAEKSSVPTKLSQFKPADILGQRDLGDGTVSVVTIHGQKFTVANDGKK